MFVQTKQRKWQKTLTRKKKNNTSVRLSDDPYQYPNGSWGMWKTNLSIVGHSTEELQLQVELTGHAVKEQPQAAGQVLSRQKQKPFFFF